MNDVVRIKLIKNSVIVESQSHSTYEWEARSFKRIEQAFAWIKDYWNHELKDMVEE